MRKLSFIFIVSLLISCTTIEKNITPPDLLQMLTKDRNFDLFTNYKKLSKSLLSISPQDFFDYYHLEELFILSSDVNGADYWNVGLTYEEVTYLQHNKVKDIGVFMLGCMSGAGEEEIFRENLRTFLSSYNKLIYEYCRNLEK